ncbi:MULTISPECIES: SDR family NAD(P)-dependent oxidoreductase [Lacticaseibacillus]|uniref:2-deoxy-D-gluconate 3-dehydrogenase n=2 Tax=Lacticaseibacillus TaxID=2759736 RepID=A0AAN1EXX7_LACCA|nr:MULTISPECIES: SDR family oxidoreductase [Lacticaseibacillus]ARY90674.1 2-deoxy-D-gluconate 3-dehydrogenase [Lacticaseibacillus casei]KAB1970529.1 SDR family oxidoreductase [Lacticaseibacillus casei]WLV81288.1 SDR family oxidoreductase [Lacticaseibacillus sp. NCIMB 15473]WNX25248.1 SDR family oxidoreductase [Lacticaseibacillus casei]WNX28019.1 SDR family oxidoreductase [Lacticaseibacillus casei]
MADWLGLKDKVVVVTGAVGGMGTRFCEAFAEHGANVVLVDIKKEAIETAAKTLSQKYGVQTLPLATDTTNEDEVDDAVKAVVAKLGQVDILVNTAAILRFAPFEDLRLDEWKTALNINLTGYFLMSQRFGRQMIAQHHGTMVHISTVAAVFPETYSGAYSTTKAAVNMLSKQMAAEWGQFGIRSNCVMPCLVKTPMSADFYKDPKVLDGRERLVASRRIGDLDDITNAVLYLSSERSDYTNGGELRVDGGLSIMMQDMIPKPGGRREYAIKAHQAKK